MVSLPSKTRRELLGISLGAAGGAGLCFALPLVGYEPPSFLVIVSAILGAIFVGFLFRGELGWIAFGTMAGAAISIFIWGNPKSTNAAVGYVPGALLGLIAGIIHDIISRPPDEPGS